MTYYRAMNDAGLLREYAVETFLRDLLGTSSLESYRALQRVLARMAQLTGLAPSDILADLRADAEALCAE